MKSIFKLIIFYSISIALVAQSKSKSARETLNFQLQCPFSGQKRVSNLRTYALILNNAQKNIQINISTKKAKESQESLAKKKQNLKQQLPLSNSGSLKSQQQKYDCILNKNNKVCVFDGFSDILHIKCNSVGSASMLIVQPTLVTEILEDEPLRSQALVPILSQQQKGIVTFKSDGNFEVSKLKQSQFFLSNCIQVIEYFQHQILIGVKGITKLSIIIVNEGITGTWTFRKIQNYIGYDMHPIFSYNLAKQISHFSINSQSSSSLKIDKEKKKMGIRNFHGLKLLLRTQNKTLIQSLQLNITVVLQINDPLITEKQSLIRTIIIKEKQLKSKIPIKLAFFYSQHPIQFIFFQSNQQIHYVLELSEQRSPNEKKISTPPIIQQDQYLFYSYQKITTLKIPLQAHIAKSFRNMSTPTLRIISEGIKKINGSVKNTHGRVEDNMQNIKDNKTNSLVIQNNQILPFFIYNDNSFAELDLHVEPEQKNTKTNSKQEPTNYNTSYFKLMLQTSFIPIQIQVGTEIVEYLFQNEVKKFTVSKQKMGAIKSKKLLLKCSQCHAFISYDENCKDISCCEEVHSEKIDVKAAKLLIMITAAVRTPETARIKLILIQDEKAYKVNGGQIVEGMLTDSETYIYESDGSEEIQIICNSQAQGILLLATISKDEFPTKISFDFQSNEGYIKISSLKVKKTVYIRLIKMSTTFSIYSSYKIPYSLLVISSNEKIKLIQGKPLSHIFNKNSQRHYMLEHTCNLEINGKNYANSGLVSSSFVADKAEIQMEIYTRNSSKPAFLKQINQQFTISISKYFNRSYQKAQNRSQIIKKTNQFPNQQFPSLNIQTCVVNITLKNIAHQTFHMNVMFFKQRQRYQIYTGQFISQNLLAENKLYLYCVIDPTKPTNVYAYSLKEQITMRVRMISINSLKHIQEIYETEIEEIAEEKIKDDVPKKKKIQYPTYNKQTYQYKLLQQSMHKTPSHSQFSYIAPAQEIYGKGKYAKNTNLTVVLIQISKLFLSTGFQRENVYLVCTQNKTTLQPGNRLHYKVSNEETHTFLYPLTEQLLTDKKNDDKSNKGIKTNKEMSMWYTSIMKSQKEIVLQTTKLDGIYIAEVRIKYFDKIISVLELQKQQKKSVFSKSIKKQSKKAVREHLINQQQPIIIIKVDLIKEKIEQFLANHNNQLQSRKSSTQKQNKDSEQKQKQASLKPLKLQEISFLNLYLQFELVCHKSGSSQCTFLTSLQTSQSDIRSLTPGVPEIFHINKHSSIIFIYNNNLHDGQFKFKVNRKLGFPNYKLCSYRPSPLRYISKEYQQSAQSNKNSKKQVPSEIQDKCLSQLQTSQNQLNLLIQQNAFNTDSNLIVGRTHELIINQYNDQYCTNCTYYLGLYSGYDVVEGSIFVMSANQPTLLEEGSSITTIVYRGQPDRYMLANWESLMAMVYLIEGSILVEGYYQDGKTGDKVTVISKTGQNATEAKITNKSNLDSKGTQNIQQQKYHNRSVMVINLQQIKQASQASNSSQTDAEKVGTPVTLPSQFYLSVQPANNSPSALYTLIIANKKQQIINIKDGVPYEMKYNNEGNAINPVIKYRYRCENQGIMMISTRDFELIDIQAHCLDLQEDQDDGDDVGFQNVDDENNQIKSREQQQAQNDTKEMADKHIRQYTGKPINISDLLQTRKSYRMSNRLDINIHPKQCAFYQLTITSKTPSVSYTVLVSSTDIITLPLHKQIPGMLKYQTKLYQIYEISVNEKTQVRCIFKFCQGGDGRIMISKSKKNIYSQIYQQQIQIYEQTTYQTLRYMAKPGLFYIKVQFKGRGGILQYTIHVENTNINTNRNEGQQQNDVLSSYQSQQYNPTIRIYRNYNTISYRVLKIGYDYTEYELAFYPIVSQADIYEIEYYIVESTKLKLLKKTQNCNGQYFVEFVNHHEQIKETKINITQSTSADQHKPQTQSTSRNNYNFDANLKQSDENNQEELEQQLQRQEQKQKQIKFVYGTSTPYTFVTIVPIIYNKHTHQFYHLYVPKYHEIQLKNGQIFAGVTYVLGQIASAIQQYVDIHGSEKLILVLIGLFLCGCFCTVMLGGIWMGARYFFKIKTVYVLKEIKQEDNQEEDVEDNRVNDQFVQNNSSAAMMIEQEQNQNVSSPLNQGPSAEQRNILDQSQRIERPFHNMQRQVSSEDQSKENNGNQIKFEEKYTQSNIQLAGIETKAQTSGIQKVEEINSDDQKHQK